MPTKLPQLSGTKKPFLEILLAKISIGENAHDLF